MKIFSGKFKGSNLCTTDKNPNTRPTIGRIRQNLINILKHSYFIDSGFEELVVADAFCGFGAFGFELLSQNAKRCCFINSNSTEIECIKKTAQKLGCMDSCEFINENALKLGELSNKVNLLFLDPPYNTELGEKFLKSSFCEQNLAENHLVVWEMNKFENHNLPNWDILEERTYGKVKLLFLRKSQ